MSVIHVPADFLSQLVQRVSPSAVVVYLALESYRSAATFQCWPKQATLAKWSGQSRETIKRGIAELVQVGVVQRVQQSGKHSIYILPREFPTGVKSDPGQIRPHTRVRFDPTPLPKNARNRALTACFRSQT